VHTAERSLHHLVEKWLAPARHARVRVTRFGHLAADRCRYVRVEAYTSDSSRAIFFFEHDDGCWCVFPPRIARPSMSSAQHYGIDVPTHAKGRRVATTAAYIREL
jgi:hypothetical protein